MNHINTLRNRTHDSDERWMMEWMDSTDKVGEREENKVNTKAIRLDSLILPGTHTGNGSLLS
jgi:hypothetical protein